MRHKELGNDNFIVREGLCEDTKIVSQVQEWFNQLVGLYNEEIRAGTLVLHRALVVGILGHNNTRAISAGRGPVRGGRKNYIIKGANNRDYYIILHEDDLLPGGYIKEGNLIQPLGDNYFQEQGKKFIKIIQRLGFLNFIKQNNDNAHDKVARILSRMNTADIGDIQEALINLRT